MATRKKSGEQKPPEKKFKCRVCGHHEYHEHKRTNGVFGPGGHEWREYCVCLGCSAMFKDPEKFSK